MSLLTKACIERQSEFNDALGYELLFLFFNPIQNSRTLAKDGRFLRENFSKENPTQFLYSGLGEARALPESLVELGSSRFRSEQPNGLFFKSLAKAASDAHEHAIPFFQTVFDITPRTNNLIVAHRLQKSVRIYKLGAPLNLSSDDIINLVKAMRPIAKHSRGAVDLDLMDRTVKEYLFRADLRNAFLRTWDVIRSFVSKR